MPRLPLPPVVRALALVAALAVPAALPLHAQRAAAASRPALSAPTRLPTGEPGPGYWQQQVDYTLAATLDPARRRLDGEGTIVYHNNSPVALGELRWHLYQNIFKSGEAPASVVGRAMTRTRGITVTRLAAAGRPLAMQPRGTLMTTPLATPLAPGDSLRIEVAWTLDVPAIASLRTGSVGEDFGMAQWYPQISTYDDVHGWHDLPYRGAGEFHLEYGNWDVRLTLPRRFLVAATGTLRNPDAVLAPAQRAALAAIATRPVGSLTRVVPLADTGGRGAPDGATRSWRFTAERVRDFAWAASPAFLWNATRTGPLPTRAEGVLIHSFYTADKAGHYARSWDVARRTIEFFSARFGDYVYPQATAVSGPVEGMEYPMLAFEGVESRVLNLPEQVTVHELGHQWYPMMVGSNETRHAFMDEGFNTYIEMAWFREQYGRGGFFNPRMPAWMRGLAGRGDHRRWNYALAQLVPSTVPLLTAADDVPPAEFGAVAYQRPAAALVMLGTVVGDSVVDQALREYYARWLFKHPYPDDFFRTVESVAGRDLGWFWAAWFRTPGRLAMAVRAVDNERVGDSWRAALTLTSRGTVTMPAPMLLTLENGATRRIRVSEAAWGRGDTSLTVRVDGLPAAVRRAELDPEHRLLDAGRADNVWPRGAPTAQGGLLGVTWAGALGLLALAVLSAVLVRAAGLLDGLRLSRFPPGPRRARPAAALDAHRRLPSPPPPHAAALRARHPRRPPAGGELGRGTAYLTSAGPVWSLCAAAIILAVVYFLQQRVDAGLRPGSNFRVDAALFLAAAALTLSFVRSLLPADPAGRTCRARLGSGCWHGRTRPRRGGGARPEPSSPSRSTTCAPAGGTSAGFGRPPPSRTARRPRPGRACWATSGRSIAATRRKPGSSSSARAPRPRAGGGASASAATSTARTRSTRPTWKGTRRAAGACSSAEAAAVRRSPCGGARRRRCSSRAATAREPTESSGRGCSPTGAPRPGRAPGWPPSSGTGSRCCSRPRTSGWAPRW
jgi:hypothetical protein